MTDKVKSLKRKIINIGKKLYDLRLVSACAGNLSSRLSKSDILITATGTCLGNLQEKDIIKTPLNNNTNKRVSSEFPLHRQIYNNFDYKVIIHCHPPLVNGYFSVFSELKMLTFESKFYLGDVPVVKQKSLTIEKPEYVIKALKHNKLVVIKNHGVVCVGNNFADALYLIEVLEESVKVAALARLFNKNKLNGLDKALKTSLVRKDTIS